MDREFRNNALYKPLPVLATVRTNGNLRLLQLTPPPDNSGTPGWDTLVADFTDTLAEAESLSNNP